MKVSLQMLSGRQDFLFTDEHSAQLPVVRITKIILENFKNVEYGAASIPYLTARTLISWACMDRTAPVRQRLLRRCIF